MKPSDIKPIRFLQGDAARIVTEASKTHEPLDICRNGEAKIVMQDFASHAAQQQTTALLKILGLGQKEIAEGKVIETADVFAELDRLDKEADATARHD